MKRPDSYVPALRYHWLTRLYDPVVATTTRERHFKTQLIEQAQVPPHAHVLDVGCGTGTLAVMLAERVPNVRLIGLDADPTVLAMARAKAAKHQADVTFEQGFANALPFPENRFERVVSSLFFHHLTTDTKQQTLREIYRVLTPGGELHIADWGKASNGLMRALFVSIQLLDGFETTRDNIEGRLPALIEAAGLIDIQTTETISTVFGTVALYRARKRAV